MDKYYVRIRAADMTQFELHLRMQGAEFSHLSTDIGPAANSTALYAIMMDGQAATTLKLSFPLVGCMNFQNTMNKLKT